MLPAAQAELPYWEWARLVEGLMDDTPLGRVVAVRAETDRKAISGMNQWQRRIRAEWAAFKAKQLVERSTPEKLRADMDSLEKAMAKMFGGGANA